MKIGKLSTASGTTIESIRFYEREGLIAEPARTDGNYRVYGDEHVQRLVFIRRCRSLDMALDEVRVLLGFKDAPSANCGDVNVVLDEHIGHVTSRVQELRVLERQLRELRLQCQSIESGADCGILKQLSSGVADEPVRPKPRADIHRRGAAVHGRPTRQSQR
ncbi:MAG: Cd(II)/Pb(II)-responsive transcriptional regulator [Rhizobacter sp.]